MSPPNYFKFAVNERAQDAFLCWMIVCLRSKNRIFETLGKSAVVWLFNNSRSPGEKKIGLEDVEGLVGDPVQQARLNRGTIADVQFEVRINGRTVPFLIEDKVYTQMHAGQLKRLKKYAKPGTRCIYFKTGYVSPEEHEATREAEFSVKNSKDIGDFLGQHEDCDSSDVFRDFVSNHRERVHQSRARIDGVLSFPGKRASADDGQDWPFDWHDAQWTLMIALYERVEPVLKMLADQYPVLKERRKPHSKREIGGPWTQWWWAKCYSVPYPTNAANAEEDEALFWRIDQRGDLRLHHYVWVTSSSHRNNAAWCAHRMSRLACLQRIWDEVASNMFGNAVKGRPNYKVPRNEMAVGIIRFNAPEYTVEKVLDKMPDFHREFIRRIKECCRG